jgi:hypothetical protein
MPGLVLEALLAPQARLEPVLQQAVLVVTTVRVAQALLVEAPTLEQVVQVGP